MKKLTIYLALIMLIGLLAVGCTNLDEEVYSQLPMDSYGTTPSEINSILAPTLEMKATRLYRLYRVLESGNGVDMKWWKTIWATCKTRSPVRRFIFETIPIAGWIQEVWIYDIPIRVKFTVQNLPRALVLCSIVALSHGRIIMCSSDRMVPADRKIYILPFTTLL